MEIIETAVERKFHTPISNNENQFQPESIRPTKKYIQPARAKPLPPRGVVLFPPKSPIELKTTYHTSYYNEVQVQPTRPKPILPINSIHLPNDKLPSDTTNKLSFPPAWGIHKAKPIGPRHRIRPQEGPMEKLTTIRQAFEAKFTARPEMIVPRGSIRTGQGTFDTTTTTLLSYMNPGPVEPVSSFRPIMKYRRPAQPTATETTQKLSYLPYEMAKKENHPWAQKPVYRRPEVAMPGETTYTKTYLENRAKKEAPILPRHEGVLPSGAEFAENSVYKESFLPCQPQPVAPILPSQNIALSDKKMTCVTTNKLSYQPVKGEKRKPIMPRRRKILSSGTGSIQNVTTTRQEFIPKFVPRPKVLIPSGHIRSPDLPLEDKTVTSLSFARPGPVSQLQNFKPVAIYREPEKKIEGETVNKLSYPQWPIGPREKMPWAQKKPYEPPKDAMPSTTVYHMSFPAPGHYVEEPDDTEPGIVNGRDNN